MAKIVFTTFAEVQTALQTFVTNNNIPISGAPHGVMWEKGGSTPDEKYQYFVTKDAIPGFPILTKGSGKTSNIILALSGKAPFDGSTFPQMPPGGPYLATDIVEAISAWIDAGAKQ
ncbi:hypothetical protein RZS28_03740 [Methylocapsa polymorpha]|uniref:Uncharacterized protein n=1 Tax=Methylocapsa polymorpha TaxID=3080828 RepID=A0ABZ0HT88_9HYPH|nr:hypothetical protein RZS28_03740 [Methylocapsa sp. RX1]